MASPAPGPATLDPATSAGELVRHQCDQYVAWYEDEKRLMRRLDGLFQAVIILSAAATSFVVAIGVVNKALLATPAMLTTVATAARGVFRFREKHVSFATAAEKLKFERLDYQSRAAGSQPTPADVEKFATALRTIVSDELGAWREMQSDAGQLPTNASRQPST